MLDFFWNTKCGLSILVKNLEKSDQILQNPSFIKNVEEFSNKRGRVLSLSVSIEEHLDQSIEYLLFDMKNDLSDKFKRHFIKSGILTFFHKWKIFNELYKENKGEKTNKIKGVITSIQNVIKIRNKYAHGTMYYDGNKKKFYFEYIQDYKSRIIELTSDVFDTDIKSVYDCLNSMSSLFSDDAISTEKKLIIVST